jgi:hypothetical protein
VIVVDDRLLLEILSGTETTEIAYRAAEESQRRSRGVTGFHARSRRFDGSLTREFAALNDDRRAYVHALLEDLPNAVEMLHPRDLVPPMSAVTAVTSVNFLTAEAIAASLILEAPILVSTRSALMDRAASQAGVECLVISRT